MTTTRILHLLVIALLAGFVADSSAQTQPPPSPQALKALREAAQQAERNCTALYNRLRWVQIRNPRQSKALAAALRLRDVSRKWSDATVSERWPRPEWLRSCSDILLSAWVDEEQYFPSVEAAPSLLDLWSSTETSLVVLYNTALPVMGESPSRTLPQALTAGVPKAGSSVK